MKFSNSYRPLFFSCIIVLLQLNYAVAQNNNSSGHINIAMRMIGNEILLQSGDDSSIVMPVEKVKNRFKISFENQFALDPLKMADAIHPIILERQMATKYRVEVEWCDSNVLVYGYEIGMTDSTNAIACARRLQPIDCYNIFITLLDDPLSDQSSFPILHAFDEKQSGNSKALAYSLTAILLGLLALVILAKRSKKKEKAKKTTDYIFNIGSYQYNCRTMQLSSKSGNIELTGKEGELLLVLYNASNQTVERTEILKQVWGDEGDYVGRTLDVFISKLRKKLQDDNSIKIINIRGVGYKLLLNY